MRQAGSGSTGGGPRSGYDELDTTLMPPRPGEQYGRGGSGGSPANVAAGSTGSAAGVVPPGVPPHGSHHFQVAGGGPAGLFTSPILGIPLAQTDHRICFIPSKLRIAQSFIFA